MNIELPGLPYATDALEPHISRRTMEFHHGKHHATYVEKLKGLVEGKQYAKMPLVDIVRASASKQGERAIFNNAAQAWNHAFFWNCMHPEGGGAPPSVLATKLDDAFGGYDGFRQAFVEAATGQFGSGWVWLVTDGDRLSVVGSANADTPLTSERVPLLVCDVWEHAYYLDYQHRRQAFVEAFLDHLVNWQHVTAQLRKAKTTQRA